MPRDAASVRDALVRQWRLIAAAVAALDLGSLTRVNGWRNREVLAHLTLQPPLLRRFLRTSSNEEPAVSLAANLQGTRALAQLIDGAAHEGSDLGRLDFAAAVEKTVPVLLSAELTVAVRTVQGSIHLNDYLVTRCLEAVVHGGDLVPRVEPDPEAESIAAEALLSALAERAPSLLPAAQELPTRAWIEIATGRRAPPEVFGGAVPVMT